ncbi:MAG: hypothetical protein ABL923_04660 [Burkholderiaceae bacterium]
MAEKSSNEDGLKPAMKIIASHVHVLDPARFPYAPDAWYHPTGADTAKLG